jgi:hypothetical protein
MTYRKLIVQEVSEFRFPNDKGYTFDLCIDCSEALRKCIKKKVLVAWMFLTLKKEEEEEMKKKAMVEIQKMDKEAKDWEPDNEQVMSIEESLKKDKEEKKRKEQKKFEPDEDAEKLLADSIDEQRRKQLQSRK